MNWSYNGDNADARGTNRTRGNSKSSPQKVSFFNPLIVSLSILIAPNVFFLGIFVWIFATTAFISVLFRDSSSFQHNNRNAISRIFALATVCLFPVAIFRCQADFWGHGQEVTSVAHEIQANCDVKSICPDTLNALRVEEPGWLRRITRYHSIAIDYRVSEDKKEFIVYSYYTVEWRFWAKGGVNKDVESGYD